MRPQIGARIYVTSIAQAASFYSGVIGMEVVIEDDKAGYAVLKAASGHLILSSNIDEIPQLKEPADTRSTGVYILTPIHAHLRNRLKTMGCKIICLREPPWGGAETLFVDPFGNEVSLVSFGG